MTEQRQDPGKLYRGDERRRQPFDSKSVEDTTPQLQKMAMRELSDRQVRRQIMKLELLGASIWDVLLELYIARYQRVQVASSALSHSTGIPLTTTLRYLNLLEQAGLVEKHATEDSRVRAARLSDLGYERMSEYFVQKVLKFT